MYLIYGDYEIYRFHPTCTVVLNINFLPKLQTLTNLSPIQNWLLLSRQLSLSNSASFCETEWFLECKAVPMGIQWWLKSFPRTWFTLFCFLKVNERKNLRNPETKNKIRKLYDCQVTVCAYPFSQYLHTCM